MEAPPLFRLTVDSKISYTYSVLDGPSKVRSIDESTVRAENLSGTTEQRDRSVSGRMLVNYKEAVQ